MSIGQIPSGGAPLAFVVRRSVMPLNVRDEGVLGDGSTDDSAAINAADLKAAALGRSLEFPAGTYVASGLLPTTTWFTTQGAVLKQKDGVSTSLMTLADGTENITISGFEIDGNQANLAEGSGQMISVRGTSHRITGNRIYDVNGVAAIQVFSDAVTTSKILIDSNHIENVYGYGVLINNASSAYPTDVVVSNNILIDCALVGADGDSTGAHSISIGGVAKRVLVTGNVIKSTSTSGSAIEGYDANIEDYQIIGNLVDTVGHHGSHVGGKRLVVSGNVYKNTDKRAVLIACAPNTDPTYSIDFSVTDNLIYAPASTTNGSGIEVQNFSGGVISGNRIHDPGTHGISVIGNYSTTPGTCDDITIQGNSITWSTDIGIGHGIRLSNVNRVSVAGNIVQNAAATGVALLGTNDGVAVANNVVSACVNGYQVTGTPTNCSFTGNIARGNGTDYSLGGATSTGNI